MSEPKKAMIDGVLKEIRPCSECGDSVEESRLAGLKSFHCISCGHTQIDVA